MQPLLHRVKTLASQPPVIAYDDPIFFHKSQVRVGVIIQYYGRRDPGAKWRVYQIDSHEYVKGNIWKETHPDQVAYLTDKIHLVRVGKPSMIRTVKFSGISYSAIWRLV